MNNDLITILKCVIENTKYSGQINDMQSLFEFAKKHKVESFIGYMLRSEPELLNKYEFISKSDSYNLYCEVYQVYYLENIMKRFEESGIKHMPLKGSVIKNLYPSPELRQSADLDIYIDPAKSEQARDILIDMGFEIRAYGISNHDEYCWNNIVYVELHKELVSEKYEWYDVCNRIIKDCKIENGYKYRYQMSNEDFYVFMLIHMAKHILYGGAGIRLVLDVWVYLKKVDMDESLLRMRLNEAHMYDFDKIVRMLCEFWFEDRNDVSPTVQLLSEYMIESGWNGTVEQVKMIGYMRGKSESRIRYYIKSIFWNKNKMATRYPILYKYPCFLPFCWLHRVLKAVFLNKGSIKNVIHYYDEVDDSKIVSYLGFIKKIGLVGDKNNMNVNK